MIVSTVNTSDVPCREHGLHYNTKEGVNHGKKKGCIEGLVDCACGLVGATVGLVGCFVPYGEEKDNYVERGSDFWGHKYKKTRGICYRCHGTGTIHGMTCRKCSGTGKFSRTTWYD